MRKLWYSVLLSVLILNVVNISNFAPLESPLKIPAFQELTFQNAFAQADDEADENEGDEGEHVDESEEEESQDEESDEQDEELKIQVEIENGVAKVEIKHNDEKLEFELDTTDEDAIIDEIAARIGVTKEEIEAVVEFEVETDEADEEIEDEDREEEVDDIDEEDVEDVDEGDVEDTDEVEETEIEVEIKNKITKVGLDYNGTESKFILDTTDEKEILNIISQKTGLTESQILGIWEVEVESEEEEENESEHEAKMIQKKEEATQDAQDRIAALEEQISELEQRIQNLLEKLQSGQYFGNVPNTAEVTKSFSVSFDGNAVSIQDESEAIVFGEIFLETIYTNENISKLRVTGGEMIVGETYYDVMFGKARISSSGSSGVKDSMILIGEVMDQEGKVSAVRLSIDSSIPLDVDFGQEPVGVQISTPSKIAKQWSLEATGQMEVL